MPIPVYKTKGDIRSKLLIRLGYGGLGAAAGPFVPKADEFLDTAQDEIYEMIKDQGRTSYWDLTIGVAQQWEDVPSNMDPQGVTSVSVWYQDDWLPMIKGIGIAEDSIYDDIPGEPLRWDYKYNQATGKAQIEIWPKTDAIYTVRLESELVPADFVADGDYCSVDFMLLLLHATAYGKADLNKPDAGIAMAAWDRRKNQIKARQHNAKRYIRGEKKPDPIAKPKLAP